MYRNYKDLYFESVPGFKDRENVLNLTFIFIIISMIDFGNNNFSYK